MITTTSESPWQAGAEPQPLTSGGPAPDLVLGNPAPESWLGFGCCLNELGWRALQRLAPAAREALLDRLFLRGAELNFEFCRLPVGANDFASEWYSYNETRDDWDHRHFSIARDEQGVLPFARAALARNPRMKFFASPWSPPSWLKTPPHYHGGRLNADARSLDSYARYLVRYLEAYAAAGIPIAQLHVQNEPCSAQVFPSCVMTGPEIERFVVDHLGPALAASGLPTELWLGTINGPEHDAERKYWTGFNDYAFRLFENPAARAHLRGIGYQWAGKHALARTRRAYPDVPIIQTESECGDGRNTWDEAWYVADLLFHYLTQGVSAYTAWNAVLDEDGLSTWQWAQDSLATVESASARVRLNPQWHIFRHFAVNLRAGDRPLACSAPWSANAVAFQHGQQASIVVRNPLDRAHRLHVAHEHYHWQVTLPARSLSSFTLPLATNEK